MGHVSLGHILDELDRLSWLRGKRTGRTDYHEYLPGARSEALERRVVLVSTHAPGSQMR